MFKYFILIASIASILIFSSCGSSKENSPPEKKEEVKPPVEIKALPPPEEKYDLLERGIFLNSSLAMDVKDTNAFVDPIIGEFVKLKEGNKYSVIFHQFEYEKETNAKIREIVFAFEIMALESGIKYYPEKFIYYLLSYDENKSRIDGKTIRGFIFFRNINSAFATGNFEFDIEGVKKSFDKPDIKVDVRYNGAFKLPLNNFKNLKN